MGFAAFILGMGDSVSPVTLNALFLDLPLELVGQVFPAGTGFLLSLSALLSPLLFIPLVACAVLWAKRYVRERPEACVWFVALGIWYVLLGLGTSVVALLMQSWKGDLGHSLVFCVAAAILAPVYAATFGLLTVLVKGPSSVYVLVLASPLLWVPVIGSGLRCWQGRKASG